MGTGQPEAGQFVVAVTRGTLPTLRSVASLTVHRVLANPMGVRMASFAVLTQ